MAFASHPQRGTENRLVDHPGEVEITPARRPRLEVVFPLKLVRQGVPGFQLHLDRIAVDARAAEELQRLVGKTGGEVADRSRAIRSGDGQHRWSPRSKVLLRSGRCP